MTIYTPLLWITNWFLTTDFQANTWTWIGPTHRARCFVEAKFSTLLLPVVTSSNSESLIFSSFVGMSFTWSNQREVESWPKLDRFMISPEILSLFSKMQQIGLPRSISDHYVIALCDRKMEWGPRPFRLLNEWFEDSDMMKKVVE
ncbi:hypothetical protein Ddye_027686 [Dipteronia dyeriana]|uniref:Uncharacterized protein n=1 Tax=Dipteronia dyeriana TaxID=168575 RepID=A0AAD9TQ86_9ROSI|nr:hypothetical protein Ddye_027686 [Dipteronia dyeriana]